MHKKITAALASLFVICSLAACAEEAKGPDLWHGAKVGMSVDDVLELFPDAATVTDDDPNKVTRGEEQERVRIEPYEISGLPFKVAMLFEDGKLAMVKEIVQAGEGDFDYPAAYKTTLRAVRKIHGAPYSNVDISMVSGAVWYLDKVDVNVSMWKRGGQPYDVVVTYSPAKSDRVPR